jgi:hypothetical protein
LCPVVSSARHWNLHFHLNDFLKVMHNIKKWTFVFYVRVEE